MKIIDKKCSKNLKYSDFMCHCGCETVNVDYKLIDNLELLIEYLQERFDNLTWSIEVGYRCPESNDRLIKLWEQGKYPNQPAKYSKHIYGLAVDVKFYSNGVQINPMYIATIPIPFGGIGTYDTFNHLDVGGGNRVWDNTTVKYYTFEDNKVIECNPMALKIKYGDILDTGINGAFYSKSGTLFHSAVSEGVVIEKRKIYSRYATGTFKVLRNGLTSVQTEKNFKYDGVWFMVNGLNLDYEESGGRNLTESCVKEHTGKDVLRNTYHSALGFNYKTNRAFMVLTKPMVGDDVRRLMRRLGCIDENGNTAAILLDGGGSSKMMYKGVTKHYTDRKTNNSIYV